MEINILAEITKVWDFKPTKFLYDLFLISYIKKLALEYLLHMVWFKRDHLKSTEHKIPMIETSYIEEKID